MIVGHISHLPAYCSQPHLSPPCLTTTSALCRPLMITFRFAPSHLHVFRKEEITVA